MIAIIEKPDGSPYITIRDDGIMTSLQIHDYDFFGDPVKFVFDKRTIPALIEALQKCAAR
jgi:hypothetical protein